MPRRTRSYDATVSTSPASASAPADPDPAIRSTDVTVTYGEHLAVCDATFTVPVGSLTAVIGPNGSGKTSLLRAVSGLEQVDHGGMSVLGAPPGRLRSQVAHVMQNTTVNDAVPLTVQEVVGMGRYARLGAFRRFGPADHDAVAGAMERMEVTDLAGRHLRELSGGQRQRVYVAQGLAQHADLLLLDEPVTGLDVLSQDRIGTVVREEVAAGRTIVFTTHDVEAAAQSDQVLLLATHVIAVGPPDEVLTADHLGRAYGGRVFETPEGAVVLGEPHQHGPAAVRHRPHPHDHAEPHAE